MANEQKEKPTILFIGRFQPFHLGHLKIIKRYYSKGFFIKIGIGSSNISFTKENPFTFKEREEMIKLSLKKNNIRKYSIFHLPDFKGKDETWRKKVKKIVGKFDFIITGNKWVKEIFEHENIGVFNYEEEKSRHKRFQGKKIRENMAKGKRKGISLATYKYLKKIKGVERIKKLYTS